MNPFIEQVELKALVIPHDSRCAESPIIFVNLTLTFIALFIHGTEVVVDLYSPPPGISQE